MLCCAPAPQSVKLSVLEERVLRLATLTRPLPTTLAKEGKVKIRWGDAAGRVGGELDG